MNRIYGLFRSGFAMVGACFPEPTKRLIFLASFSARLKDQDSFDSETLRKLNEVMTLAKNEQLINLPCAWSKVIWRGRVLHDIASKEVLATNFSKERLQQLADRILEATPSWLRYGSPEAMRRDVARLLDNRSVLIGA